MKTNLKFPGYLTVVILLILSLQSCSKGVAKENKKTDNAEVLIEKFPPGDPIELKELKFNPQHLASSLYKGEVETAAHWQDETGLNYLLVTLEKDKPKGSALYLYQFNRASESEEYQNVWEFRVDTEYPVELFKTTPDMVEVMDLNNDNKGEALITYLTQPSKGEAIGVNALITFQGKYGFPESAMILGGYPSLSAMEAKFSQKEFDRTPSDNFESILPEFREVLAHRWDVQLEKAKIIYQDQ